MLTLNIKSTRHIIKLIYKHKSLLLVKEELIKITIWKLVWSNLIYFNLQNLLFICHYIYLFNAIIIFEENCIN